MNDTNRTYIPIKLQKEFRTVGGCECKDEYQYLDEEGQHKTAKNSCALGYKGKILGTSWCETKENCGTKYIINNKEYYRDRCVRNRRTELLGEDKKNLGKEYFRKNLLGILFYIIVFMILIPYLLFRNKQFEFLEVYMPNFDLLATSLTFQSIALGSPYFQELYNDSSQNILGYGSTQLINYMSLVALTYIVSHRVISTKSLAKGWAFALVMLFVTYLLPKVFITYVQNKVADFLQNKISAKEMNEKLGNPEFYKFWPFGVYNIIVLGTGLLISYGFIRTEAFLLEHHKEWLDPLVNKIIKFTTF